MKKSFQQVDKFIMDEINNVEIQGAVHDVLGGDRFGGNTAVD